MLKKVFITISFLLTSLFAEQDYSLRAAFGTSSASDFDQLYSFNGLNTHPAATEVYGISGGYRIVEDAYEWPLDLYVNGSLNYFDEKGYQSNFLEGDVYIKLFIKFDFWGNQLRYGIAEGISYADRVPYVEALEAIEEGDNQSRLLNYMEMTFDFDVGKLLSVKELEALYLGYLIKHRSGMWGYYGGVSDGGSNYNCVYLEKNF
jgi:outer membrane protein